MTERDRLVRIVREIGESIIKNADDIVGNFEHGYSIKIKAELKFDDYELPGITVERSFIPEKTIERISSDC